MCVYIVYVHCQHMCTCYTADCLEKNCLNNPWTHKSCMPSDCTGVVDQEIGSHVRKACTVNWPVNLIEDVTTPHIPPQWSCMSCSPRPHSEIWPGKEHLSLDRKCDGWSRIGPRKLTVTDASTALILMCVVLNCVPYKVYIARLLPPRTSHVPLPVLLRRNL